MGSRWEDTPPERPGRLLADLLSQLHTEEPELEPEPKSIAPPLLYMLSGLLIVASGFLGYVGWVSTPEALATLATGAGVALATEAAERRGTWR